MLRFLMSDRSVIRHAASAGDPDAQVQISGAKVKAFGSYEEVFNLRPERPET